MQADHFLFHLCEAMNHLLLQMLIIELQYLGGAITVVSSPA
jgi:hypothetical protein